MKYSSYIAIGIISLAAISCSGCNESKPLPETGNNTQGDTKTTNNNETTKPVPPVPDDVGVSAHIKEIGGVFHPQ